jgi:hypothetical protein
MKETKAQKIAKEIAEHCKHGFNLTPKTCAYCQGHPVSDYPSSVGLTHIRDLATEERWKTRNPALCQ